MNKTNKTENSSPRVGRPMYNPVIPEGDFTKKELARANGVCVKGSGVKGSDDYNSNYGKGKHCTLLTLQHWLDRQLASRKNGLVVRLSEKRKPTNGLGAPQFVYRNRINVEINKIVNNPVAIDIAEAIDISNATKEYEAIKASLAIPDPIVINAPETNSNEIIPETITESVTVPVMNVSPSPEVLSVIPGTSTVTSEPVVPTIAALATAS